jgi:hypothetical protein
MQIQIDSDVEKFIKSLEKATIAKVARTVVLLEKFGFRLTMPHSKKVSDNLFELRIRGQQEVRMLYCFHKDEIYLLTGFVKKSPTIPKKEIDRAKNKSKALT